MGFTLILIWLLFSVITGLFANSKGHSGIGFFLLSIVISPILSFIIVLIIKPSTVCSEQRELSSGDSIKCSFCAELIKREALICKHCGKEVLKNKSNEVRSAEMTKLDFELIEAVKNNNHKLARELFIQGADPYAKTLDGTDIYDTTIHDKMERLITEFRKNK